MKYRKNILLRIQYYTTYININININNNNNYCYFYNYYFCKNDAKFFSYLNSKGKGRGRKNDKVKNVQLANINYYSRKEKKQILQNIYEKIILKRNIDNEKILELYLNDKDVQHILKEENINEHDKKIKRIEEIVNNEENLNKKFNQFYDLFCFDLKNVNVAIGVNKNCNINDNINDNIYDNINHNIYNNIYNSIYDNIKNVGQKNNHLNYPCDKSINNKNVFKLNNELIYNSMCTSYVKKYEYIKINLNLIKKFLVFIEKNLINYDNTSSCFKYYFSFNQFIIYFFNYSFDFIKYFDKNLLLSYISLYIKLNLFYSHQLFIDIEEKIKDDKDNKYKDKINEDKNRQVEETIYDINISDEEILDIIKNNNKNIIHMLNLLLHKEVGYYNILNVLHLYYSYYKKVKINEVIKNVHNLFNIDIYSIIKLKKHNNNNNDNNNDNMVSDHVTNLNEEQINYLYSYYSYMICLYFNYMYLLNNIIKQNNFFLPYCDENIIYLLNCIELLCENIFDNKTIIEEKIKQLIMCINNKDVERYLLKDILYNIRYNDYLDIGKNNIIDNNLKYENFDIENKKKINISYNSMYKNNNNSINYNNSDYDNYYRHIIYSNDDTNKSYYLSHNNIIHNNIIHNNMFRDKDKYLLILYTNTRKNMKSLFQNMTHFFIVQNCDVILKFLNIIYTTKYMNIYNINILFYSLCINSHVMKTYQIKNVLFFFSLYKNYFILNNVDLGNTIYNWYNKRLIYFIRKKIEVYFEHHSLENSIRSIFLLSDILSYNKIIKKILMKKLELLNIQNISPALFCQIFFLLKKLKCDARNQIGSQLFLKHYKKFIPSLTYIQILYLIENVEYLINRRKRKIFLLLILYCFKKLKENNTHLLYHDSIFISMNYIFKLINIINKFKLYQYCKRNYFVPIYEYILSFDEVQRGIKKERCQLNFCGNNKYFNHFYENNNYTFVINNNDTILIDYNKNDRNKINIKEQKVDDTNGGGIKKCDDNNKIKEHNNNIVIKDNNISSSINSYENYTNDSNVSFFLGTSINCLYKYNIKLELLTCSQIIDMIFFNINTNINIFIIGELYSDLFYRIIRNTPFRKDEILLIFKSMWMSRVYHENLFNSLLEIINNNKRIIENYLYSLDILLCLCSYKRDNMKTEMQNYKELIISLFDICFLNIDHICKNIKRQIHFYYCVLFLEVYYPILYLKIIKGKGNILSDISNQIYSNKIKEKEEISTIFDKKKNETVEEKKKLYMCMNNKVVNKYDVVRYNLKDTKMERINIVGNMNNTFNNNVEQKDNIINVDNIKEKKNKEIKKIKDIYEKNKYDYTYNIYNNFSHDGVIYPVCILKKLKEIFFIYQKKYAYKYDLIPFYELLDKLYIRKIKYNNVPIIYLKNYELNNLFVLNIYFPLIKFAILFVKDHKDDIRNDKKMKKDIIKCIHMKNIEKEHISDNKTNDNSSSHNSLYPYNFISNNLYSNDIDILIQRLYLYKYHKIHVMVLSKENVDLFFKKYTSEKQLKLINESNIVFQNVYKHIIKNNKEDHAKMLASLMKKQLQFIFSLNS